MNLNWGKYFYEMISSVLRHVGTAGMSWLGINVANETGVDVPNLDLKALGIMCLTSGIIPAVFMFWQKTPLPEPELEQTVIRQTTEITQTKKQEPEAKPIDVDPGQEVDRPPDDFRRG